MCYTDYVAQTKQALAHGKQNLTLVVEEDLILAARKVALDQGTSVNQLVRDFLAALVEESGRRRMARTRLKAAFEQGLVEVGERTWSRDDLYER
jgi:translation elongation factor EF-Ts